ncbi:hypothetical protein FE257_009042 [Aspergillus nanangensis]|uniref:Uncharacterized protein n=1 Tax=Aspergillus nanangensis TaxID=2582783 RepID=A0AAD4CWM5_ASPNN|nr:hypothetical protein FE257_009042 [Aspergillus nanangensis]
MPIAIGPLTSTFTPPGSCLTDIYRYAVPTLQCKSGTTTNTCHYKHLGPISATDCYPSGFTANPTATYYYSPGVCPSGYSIACSNVVSIGATSETRATCCPSSFQCQTDTNAPVPWVKTDSCTRTFADTSTYIVTSVGDDTQATTIITTSAGGMNAYGLQVRFQEADFITGGLSSSPASVSASPTSTSALSSPSPSPSSSLSTGAIAGIGVGAGIGGILVFLLVAFLLWKRRRPRQSFPKMMSDGISERPEYKAELSGGHTNQVSEMWVPPPEMDNKIPTAELEGKSPNEEPAGKQEPVELGTGK